MSNVGPSIVSKLDRRLLAQPSHPVSIVRALVCDYFREQGFEAFEHSNPVVSVEENFDRLCFPWSHPSRRPSDTYYLNNTHLLRTHMTANEPEYIRAGHRRFLVSGDVYRRDQIDSTHYPVFHQLEGVRIFGEAEWREREREPKGACPFIRDGIQYDYEKQDGFDVGALNVAARDLNGQLSGLVRRLFGPSIPVRWQTCHFPFTCPSYEIEIEYRGRWVEVCGSGVLQSSILRDCGAPEVAWAFGLGLERLAMILFDIPDIRWFWSRDERFLRQFTPGKVSKFVPISRYPSTSRDLSFWLGEGFELNSLCDVIRQQAGDLVEDVQQVDEYCKGAGRTSHCYRITYRAIDRTLTDAEVNVIQEAIRMQCVRELGLDLR
jgi:phenylalanyl-tRNA synthetase alpha chain